MFEHDLDVANFYKTVCGFDQDKKLSRINNKTKRVGPFWNLDHLNSSKKHEQQLYQRKEKQQNDQKCGSLDSKKEKGKGGSGFMRFPWEEQEQEMASEPTLMHPNEFGDSCDIYFQLQIKATQHSKKIQCGSSNVETPDLEKEISPHAKRQKTKTVDITKNVATSVHVPLDKFNKGRILLEKMGWSGGNNCEIKSGLGNNGAQAITEPLHLPQLKGRNGLGSTLFLQQVKASKKPKTDGDTAETRDPSVIKRRSTSSPARNRNSKLTSELDPLRTKEKQDQKEKMIKEYLYRSFMTQL